MPKTHSFMKGLGYPVETPNSSAEVLYGVVWLADYAQRRVAEALKPFHLTPAKLNYLMVIKHIGRSEGISPQEITKRLLIDTGNVTHYLDSLERRGWVIRLREGPDLRWRSVKMTPKGDKLLDDVWPIYSALIEELACAFPRSSKQQLVRALSRCRENLMKGKQPAQESR